MPRACADTTCAGAEAGHGVASLEEAVLTMSSFIVERAALCGVFIGRDGQMDLHDGVIRDSPFGLCLEVEGYDVARLTDNVAFVNNGMNSAMSVDPP